MDELNVLELHSIKYFLHRRSVYIRAVLRQSCGVILNVGVFRAGMKQRACGSSVQIEYNGAEVHIRELLCSVHPEIFKARCIVGVQDVSVLFGHFKLGHCILFCLRKKSALLVIFLFNSSRRRSFFVASAFNSSTKVFKPFASSLALVATSAHFLASSFTS